MRPKRRGEGPAGGGENIITKREHRAPRASRIVKELSGALASQAAAIIDEATGEPHGAAILKALAVIATGTPEEVAAFFGHKRVTMRLRDRQAALAILEQRRFGRVPTFEEAKPEVGPVTIVNVYATSEEYRFVTEARPKVVSGPKALEAPRAGGDDEPS
jgi:hypothetical protein